MTILLVRHAVALARRKWRGQDELRPLTHRGARQAAALVARCADFRIAAVYSSPAVRCIETVTPLARDRGLSVLRDEALSEGTGTAAMPLLDNTDDVVLCAHGDNLPELLLELAGHLDDVSRTPTFAKGATWALERKDGKVIAATYLAPPT